MSLQKEEVPINTLLSEITDHNENIYDMTRELAGVAKQIKEDTKEDPEPPKPVLEAVIRVHENLIN